MVFPSPPAAFFQYGNGIRVQVIEVGSQDISSDRMGNPKGCIFRQPQRAGSFVKMFFHERPPQFRSGKGRGIKMGKIPGVARLHIGPYFFQGDVFSCRFVGNSPPHGTAPKMMAINQCAVEIPEQNLILHKASSNPVGHRGSAGKHNS